MCHLFDYRICRRMVLVSRRDKTVYASDLSKPWNIGIALGRIHASGQENGRRINERIRELEDEDEVHVTKEA